MAVTAAHSRRPVTFRWVPGRLPQGLCLPLSAQCGCRGEGGGRFVVWGPQPFPFHLPDSLAAEPSDSVPLDRPTPQNHHVPPNVVFTL